PSWLAVFTYLLSGDNTYSGAKISVPADGAVTAKGNIVDLDLTFIYKFIPTIQGSLETLARAEEPVEMVSGDFSGFKPLDRHAHRNA
ncbi:hypothetical protein, partial [Streptococcus pneumoniae]|uniref:hypothetical protein n=1 Tax=Streptococcus pneumoniae TaxID=1313 RepID=UPI0018B02980